MGARNGKIARLPRPSRDELARRIEDGEPGKDLVQWLNGLPAVQDVLKEQNQCHCAPLWAQAQLDPLAEFFGGGEFGPDIAACVLELRKGLPLGTLGRKPLADRYKPRSPSPNQTKSNQIKPNQGEKKRMPAKLNPGPVTKPPKRTPLPDCRRRREESLISGLREGQPFAVRQTRDVDV